MALGNLKIYMGYAAGVGKTYRMLEDAHALQDRGVDVVVGYFEPHGREDTIARAEGLEIVPRRKIEYRGAFFEEMDTEAILARAPRVCAVDEFPHTNVPGAGREKRWQDVQAVLETGIDVITTMNIQHLESLNDQVWQITGIRVRETIPDWVVHQARDIVMVDLTPRALLHRLARGVVYGREKAEQALQNFFREPTLAALRELALRETAHELEHRHEHRSRTPQRLLAVITRDPESVIAIRRARRLADFLAVDCFAAAVTRNPDEALQTHLNFARNLRLDTRILESDDAAGALVDFARRNEVTQIVLARSAQRHWFFQRDLAQQIAGLAKDMQIVIVSARQPDRR